MAGLRDALTVDMAPARPSIPVANNGLRDTLQVNMAPDMTQFTDQADTVGMGPIQKGFVSSRYGTDADYLAARESEARARGDIATADGLRQHITALQQRAATFAPAVQRVEDVHGIGDVPGYVGGQVGMGAASMLDPIAAATGIGAAGKLIGLIPHPIARGIGAAAQFAAPAAAYGLTARQAKGEFVNSAAADPAIAAGKTPEQINDEANIQGAISGALDSVLPSLVGRRVVGHAGVKALGKLPAPAKIGLDSLGEGVTEVLQQKYQQHGLGNLNPNRDTSGDTMDLVNAGVGAFIGSAPISGGSHVIAAAHERIGRQGEIRAKEPGSSGRLIDTLADSSKGASKLEAASKWANDLHGAGENVATDPEGATRTQHSMLLNELQALAPSDATARDLLGKISAIDPKAPTAEGYAAMDAAANHVIETAGQKNEDANMIAAYERAQKKGRVLSTEIDYAGLDATKGPDTRGVTDLKKANHPDVVAAREAAATLKQRQELTADVLDKGLTRPGPMGTDAYGKPEPTQVPADPRLHKIARELGTEIANMASEGVAQKPTPGEVSRTYRIGQQLVNLYGKKTPEMVAEIGRTAGIKGTPLHANLTNAVKNATLSARDQIKERVVSRGLAARDLVSLVPPKVEQKLRAKGLDLTTSAGREFLLHLVQEYFDGTSAHNTLAMNNLLGKDVLAEMEKIVGRRIAARAGDMKLRSVNLREESGQDTEDRDGSIADKGTTKDTSDDFEQKAQDKGDEKVAPLRQFLFHGEQGFRGNDTAQEPFAPNNKKSSEQYGKLPTLVTADRLDKDGLNSLQKMHEKAFNMLGIDLFHNPNQPTTARQKEGSTVTHVATDKSPNMRVEVVTALQAMKAQGKTDDQIVSLMHAYRAQEGEKSSGKMGATIGERTKLKKEAQKYFSERFLIQADTLSNNDHLILPMSKLREMTQRGADKLTWARVGEGGKVKDQRNIADAENKAQLIRFRAMWKGKEIERAIPASDLARWANSGNLAHTQSDSFDRAVTRNRGVEFRNNLLSGIAALVHMGYTSEMPYMISATGKKESFADGLPPSLSIAGKTQAELLKRHEKKVARRMPMVKEERAALEAEAIAEGSKRYMTGEGLNPEKDSNEAASLDQALSEPPQRQVETPEELLHEGKEAPRERVDISGEQDTGQRALPGMPKEERVSSDRRWEKPKAEHYDETQRNTIGAKDDKGKPMRVPRAPMSPEVADHSRSEDRVPSEAEKPVKPGAMPIDRTDVQGRTSKLNIGKEKDQALTGSIENAIYVGKTLWRDYMADPKAALVRAERFMSSAARGEFPDAHNLVGGRFHVAPVAEMVSWKNLSTTTGEARQTLEALRSRVAEVLLAASPKEIHNNDKMSLVRGMMEQKERDVYWSPDEPQQPKLRPQDMPDVLKGFIKEATAETPEQTRVRWVAEKLTKGANGLMEAVKNLKVDRLENLHTVLRSEKPASVTQEVWDRARERVEQKLNEMATQPDETVVLPTQEEAQAPAAQSVAATESVRDMPMNYKDGTNGMRMRPALVGKSTMDLIREGVRTATTGAIGRFKGLKVGDVFTVVGADDERIKVRMTEAPRRVSEISPSAWAEPEGWMSTNHAKYKDAWQIRYELAEKPATATEVGPTKTYVKGDMLSLTSVDGTSLAPVRVADVFSALGYQFAVHKGGAGYVVTEVSSGSNIGVSTELMRDAIVQGKEKLIRLGKEKMDAAYEAAMKNRELSQQIDDPVIEKNRAETTRMVNEGIPTTDEAKAAATKWIAEKLAPGIKVLFENVMGGTAEWLSADRVIKIAATTGPGILQRAYHEGMHALWDEVLANHPEAQRALTNAASTKDMIARMTALLHGSPEAIKAINSSPTERVAYAFQFWKAGMLDMDTRATTMFQKFTRFLRQVFGKVRDSEHALAIFDSFAAGSLANPSEAGRVIAEEMKKGQSLANFRKKHDAFFEGLRAATSPIIHVFGNSESASAREVGLGWYTNPGDNAHGGKNEGGVLNRTFQKRNQYNNIFYKLIEGMSNRDLKDISTHLNSNTPIDSIHYEPVQKAVKGIGDLLRHYRDYALEAGLHLPDLGKGYFPRVWDRTKLVTDPQAFKNMLLKEYPKVLDSILKVQDPKNGALRMVTREDVAEQLHIALVERGGVEDMPEAAREDGILSPFFASQKERNFVWLKGEHATPFLSTDLVSTMTTYINQGVRAAEYTRRWGLDGRELSKMFDQQLVREKNDKGEWVDKRVPGKIEQELIDHAKANNVPEKEQRMWVARRMEDLSNANGAAEGTLGKDISPTLRKMSSYMVAYQNLRLLPMGLFSMAMDPLGIKAAGGTSQDSYDAFARGLREVWRNWKENLGGQPTKRQRDEWENLADIVGTVSSHMFLEHMGAAQTSEFVAEGARKMGRFLFMANGMTAWDRAMRIGATKAAAGFIEKHAHNVDKEHSARWLEQLGLSADTVPLDKQGNLITDRHVLAAEKDIPLDEATKQMAKLHYGIARWVERAVLSPNAALRPAWGSDPHCAVLMHLKSFSLAYQTVQMRYAAQEAEAGNNAPALALAAAVPVMMASDLMKGMLLGGGSLPAWQANMDMGERLAQGIARSGNNGYIMGLMPWSDPLQVLGPTVNQITDIAKHAVFNQGELLSDLHKAVPIINYLHQGSMGNMVGAIAD